MNCNDRIMPLSSRKGRKEKLERQTNICGEDGVRGWKKSKKQKNYDVPIRKCKTKFDS